MKDLKEIKMRCCTFQVAALKNPFSNLQWQLATPVKTVRRYFHTHAGLRKKRIPAFRDPQCRQNVSQPRK